jgi:hypothetical protein
LQCCQNYKRQHMWTRLHLKHLQQTADSSCTLQSVRLIHVARRKQVLYLGKGMEDLAVLLHVKFSMNGITAYINVYMYSNWRVKWNMKLKFYAKTSKFTWEICS